MEATIQGLSVYIGYTEVWYLTCPRYHTWAVYHDLQPCSKERLDNALTTAKEIAARFIADGRQNATPTELKKAFNRTHQP